MGSPGNILGQRVFRRGIPLPSILDTIKSHIQNITVQSFAPFSSSDESSLEVDVCIVGGGPGGLAAATRLKQGDRNLSVCVLEKGKNIGSHTMSGCVLETSSLDELHPGWKEDATCPVRQQVTQDSVYFFTQSMAFPLPKSPDMKNKGNYVVSLSQLTRWLGRKAEELGVEVFPGFAAQRALYQKGHSGGVTGVITGEFGRDKEGNEKSSYIEGMKIHAKVTLLAEGCRGSVSEQVIKHYSLREKNRSDPQTYALGIKEIWKIDPSKHRPGSVWHSLGYPLSYWVHGGGFCYHMENDMLAVGLVTALDYNNPFLSPYGEFQKLKNHPKVANLLDGGECVEYGARCLTEGGLQSLPFLAFPGGSLIGESAGMVNASKLKGVHLAIKSGILAADQALDALKGTKDSGAYTMTAYHLAVEDSSIHNELYRARNIRPAFSQFGKLLGMIYSGIDSLILRGGAPWTLRMRKGMQDYEHLKPAHEFAPPLYPKPDGIRTFHISESLYRSGVNHEHDQPCHLSLRNPKIPSVATYKIFGGPEMYYCPGNVYEYCPTVERVGNEKSDKDVELIIHSQNCLHCKACDIKDPLQNIQWTPPEGGGGPSYSNM